MWYSVFAMLFQINTGLDWLYRVFWCCYGRPTLWMCYFSCHFTRSGEYECWGQPKIFGKCAFQYIDHWWWYLWRGCPILPTAPVFNSRRGIVVNSRCPVVLDVYLFSVQDGEGGGFPNVGWSRREETNHHYVSISSCTAGVRQDQTLAWVGAFWIMVNINPEHSIIIPEMHIIPIACLYLTIGSQFHLQGKATILVRSFYPIHQVAWEPSPYYLVANPRPSCECTSRHIPCEFSWNC